MPSLSSSWRIEMASELKMPALSPTMEKGTLARWLVAVGDAVKSGDIVAEIETDKATMEFEAVEDGRIASLAVAEGTDDIPVGTIIATMDADGEEVAAPPPPEVAKTAREASADAERAPPSPAPEAAAVPVTNPAPVRTGAMDAESQAGNATPLARRIARASRGRDHAARSSRPTSACRPCCHRHPLLRRQWGNRDPRRSMTRQQGFRWRASGSPRCARPSPAA